MIASRKHGFIFIKTMKTAGTSIELALGPHCDSDDVLTPIGAAQDIQRVVESGVSPRNFGTPEIEKRYRRGLQKRNPKLLKRVLGEVKASGLWAHALPDAIKAKVGDFWDAAYRFTSERHPYEKALSRAAMMKIDIETVVFTDRLYVGHPWYFAKGRLIVDRVIRYERLAADVGEVMARFGLPLPQLPHARNTDRDRRPGREQLTPAQRAFIYEQCAPEFELFGWER